MAQELYTVLLVDDEEEVIEVIQKKLDWNSIGFKVIGAAQNGIKALEMIEENQPDVVLTDIKMPFMSGLELAKRLNHEFPSIKVMLFTGFDEFEYAKEAVHLEVTEYILKPVNPEELTRIFTNLKKTLDRERDEKKNVEKLQNYYLQSLPQLQGNFLSALIERRIPENSIKKDLEDYRINIVRPVICVVDFHTSRHHIPAGMTEVLLPMSVEKYARERFTDRWNSIFFSYLGSTLMIVQLDKESGITEVTDECDRFARSALHLLGAVVTAGIGRCVENIKDLADSYSGAREAVSYRVLYGTSRAINIREIAPKEEASLEQVDNQDLHKLLKSIILGTPEAIRSAVSEYMDARFSGISTPEQYRIRASELVGGLQRFCRNNYITWNSGGNGQDLYQQVPEMDRAALKEFLEKTALYFNENLTRSRNNTSHGYVARAQGYVQENYANPDLTLEEMCRELGVSGSYFSSIFKKETGQSFTAYLTDYRMQEAIRLIMESVRKNYEIAEAVGYSDPNYFSYVFKKRYGMSPSKYRQTHKESGEVQSELPGAKGN